MDSFLILGMTIGAISGGKLIKFGRRLALLISACVGLVGISIT